LLEEEDSNPTVGKGKGLRKKFILNSERFEKVPLPLQKRKRSRKDLSLEEISQSHEGRGGKRYIPRCKRKERGS